MPASSLGTKGGRRMHVDTDVDVLGMLKSFAIPVTELETALEDGSASTALRWKAARDSPSAT